MSASLVGSEMCIRDRPRNVGPSSALESVRLGLVAPPDFLRDLFDIEPVSYTHLTLPTICSV
eukprot:12654459-Alexandrium_andersonii.AAC.1